MNHLSLKAWDMAVNRMVIDLEIAIGAAVHFTLVDYGLAQGPFQVIIAPTPNNAFMLYYSKYLDIVGSRACNIAAYEAYHSRNI